MTQRIPLKEEKHYLKGNQLQDGKEIPIFFPPEERRKREREEMPAKSLRVLPMPATCSPSTTPGTQTPDQPSSSCRHFKHLLKLDSPPAWPLVSLFSASTLLPEALISSYWALGKLFRMHSPSWRPPTGGPPAANPHARPAVPTCSRTHNLTKKRHQASTGSTAGKSAPPLLHQQSATSLICPPRNHQDKAKVLNSGQPRVLQGLYYGDTRHLCVYHEESHLEKLC